MNRPARLLLSLPLAVAIVWMVRGDPRKRLPPSPDPRHDTAAAERAGHAAPTRPAQHIPLPTRDADEEPEAAASLEGTEVAGALLVDAAGNFVPTADAVSMFEYFLSVSGEIPREEILARIRAEIARRLSPPADAQALAFLDRYMTYREQAQLFGAGDSEDGDLRARFERMRELRRRMFGPEIAEALFGQEEAAAEVAIEQREVAADPNLTDEERAARIEELYGKLPEPLRKAHEETMAAVKLREDEARLRASGAGPEAIRALRVERFGEDAADRLEELDRENAQWDARLASFRAERARIRADRSLTPQQQEAAVARLLADSFEERERIRVEALDEIGGQ